MAFLTKTSQASLLSFFFRIADSSDPGAAPHGPPHPQG